MAEESPRELTSEEIAEQISKIEITMLSAEAHYLQVKHTCRQEIANLRKQCTHPKTTYHPDPSGNNDSCYRCDTCGKEAKRL